MKRIIVLILIGFGLSMLCTAQTQPAPESGIYRQEGIASWYGSEYDGRYTASGEIFDASKFTAAHPTLPFGTILTVTNLQNNKQVIVRVNDRGPLKPVRLIDVSQAAADQLDMIVTGTAPVLVESRGSVVISSNPAPVAAPPSSAPVSTAAQPAPVSSPPASPPPAVTPVVAAAPVQSQSPSVTAAQLKPGFPPVGTDKRYRIQVGAYQGIQNATNAFDRLKNIGLNPAYERIENLYRVVLAGIRADEVVQVAEKIGSAGFREAWIREEP